MSSIAHIRTEYSRATLDISEVHQNPIEQFALWFNEALAAQVPEPTAMHLCTVNESGRPSGRMVLLKGVENSRFVFYTNYQSRKGRDLDENPACALTFFWPELERQVRIEGLAKRVSVEQSDAYFQSRPRSSQVGAWSSPQSTIIENRFILEERMQAIEKRFEAQDPLPRPHQWGGYEVDPTLMEFWQGRPNRLHDRILYLKMDNQWTISRLAP
ncbi:MAG: pyridoxamine 5'-phosphate oxidase [Cyclobacteriaceae bacterium]|jgi:pyridoxamine 5'-phosphate oxidase|nr:pyridoxamine 5'-phosphate oxidase [Cyclobacteriaceae bacterium]